MNKTLILIGLLTTTFVTAQSVSKQVIASSGNTISNTSNQLTYTLGETAIGLKSTTVSIDQGFLANLEQSGTLSTENSERIKAIQLYPNPVAEILHINFGKASKHIIHIYDLKGKQLFTLKSNTTEEKINLSFLANGIYVVRLENTESNTIKSFKILKK